MGAQFLDLAIADGDAQAQVVDVEQGAGHHEQRREADQEEDHLLADEPVERLAEALPRGARRLRLGAAELER